MGKYAALGRYLRGHGSASVSVRFVELERILGAPLPASARSQRSWWSNNPENNVATKEWLAAGYQTEGVDLRGEKVVFRRQAVATQVADALAPVWTVEASDMAGKATKEDPLFGALKGTVYIPPGVDLTEPALDLDWEEEWLKKWDEKLADPGWQRLQSKKDE